MKKLLANLLGQREKDPGRFTSLRPGPLLSTVEKLEKRIFERFPESGLGRVCAEFRAQAEADVLLAERLEQPFWPLRLFSWVAILGLIGLVFQLFRGLFGRIATSEIGSTFSDLMQGIDSAVNEIVFLGIAIFFLSSLETRWKRRRSLAALHRLRSLAHVVDMHQLTKDPTVLLSPQNTETDSSPVRGFTPFELSRYLDYCSEMLALIAKTAALFSQNTADADLLAAVGDLEQLTASLSGKIWQKIMILDAAIERQV